RRSSDLAQLRQFWKKITLKPQKLSCIAFRKWTATLRSIALARRNVDSQQHAAGRRDHVHGNTQHRCRQWLDLAAKGPKEVIIVLVVLAEAARTQPTRNGAASGSEQQTAQQGREPPRHASVQQAGQPIDPD